MGAITGIHHLCVQTPDINKSLEFYTKLIGFELVSRETCDFGEYAMLRLGTSRIELIQPNVSNECSFGSTGALAHFGLQVHHIDEVYDSLRQKGVVFSANGVQSYDHPMGGFRAVSMKGVSGETINLYEFKHDF